MLTTLIFFHFCQGERVWHLAETEEECGNYTELYQRHDKPYDLCSEVSLNRIELLWGCAEFSNYNSNENHDIAIEMSSSRADPMLGLNILQGWLKGFKYLNQCFCPGWGRLNQKSNPMWHTHTDRRTQPFIVKDVFLYFLHVNQKWILSVLVFRSLKYFI